MSRIELAHPKMQRVIGVHSGYIVTLIEKSIITEAAVVHYPRFDMFSQSNEKLWSKAYDVDFGGPIFPLPEGFYVVGSGRDADMSPSNFAGCTVKLSTNGDIEWGHFFPECNSSYSDAIVENDGGVIAVGIVYEASDGSTQAVACAASYSPSGEKRWEKTYDELTGTGLVAVAQTKNGYLIAGVNYRNRERITLALLNEEGEIIARWEELLGYDLYGPKPVSLHNTSQGTYMVINILSEVVDERLDTEIRYCRTIVRRIE